MDFTLFAPNEAIPALTWLGKRDWLDFGCSDSFDKRAIWTRIKQLEVSAECNNEVWNQVERIGKLACKDIVYSFYLLALSRSIANGPKIFQPTYEDCIALENTACTMSFEDYNQPYPVVIIELPKEYKKRLAQVWRISEGPSYIIAYHDEQKRFINMNTFFNFDNVLTYLAPARKEYKSIENCIISNQESNFDNEFKVAELTQRLAINFCMVMSLLGVRQIGPMDASAYEKAKKLIKRKDKYHRSLGQKTLDSTCYKIEFIQKINLFEEEFIQPRQHSSDPTTTHASPKPHWRRGHYRQQPCGIKLSERKLVFIKPVLVRSNLFSGDIKNTEVTYTIK